ncbi:MAG: hypothetical protein JW850_11065 [Thermoflexales bacterium]|nr:hypothetical protein [Thermoflexales bacterium]
MNTQIDTAVKRARGYWFVDGFTEMIAGALFIVLGGVLVQRGLALQASILTQLTSIAGEVSIVKLVGLLVAILVLVWLKNRFTYPRTGFVKEKWMTTAQVPGLLGKAILFVLPPVVGLVAVLVYLFSVRGLLAAMPAWFPVMLGVLLAVPCILAGAWMGLGRFRLMGVLILLAGIAIGAWQLVAGLPSVPPEAFANPWDAHSLLAEMINRTFVGVGLVTLLSGVVFAISGVVTFLRYRKENPRPYEEEA